jgi:hypothetical protein
MFEIGHYKRQKMPLLAKKSDLNKWHTNWHLKPNKKTNKMKFTAFVITALMLAFTGLAQSTIKEKDLMGMWKFEFNLRESIDKEIDKDNPMAKALAEGLTGFVDALLGEIDIRFDFQKNNLL